MSARLLFATVMIVFGMAAVGKSTALAQLAPSYTTPAPESVASPADPFAAPAPAPEGVTEGIPYRLPQSSTPVPSYLAPQSTAVPIESVPQYSGTVPQYNGTPVPQYGATVEADAGQYAQPPGFGAYEASNPTQTGTLPSNGLTRTVGDYTAPYMYARYYGLGLYRPWLYRPSYFWNSFPAYYGAYRPAYGYGGLGYSFGNYAGNYAGYYGAYAAGYSGYNAPWGTGYYGAGYSPYSAGYAGVGSYGYGGGYGGLMGYGGMSYGGYGGYNGCGYW